MIVDIVLGRFKLNSKYGIRMHFQLVLELEIKTETDLLVTSFLYPFIWQKSRVTEQGIYRLTIKSQ